MTLTPEQTKKFWGQVSKGKGNSCWLWKGAKSCAYGVFHFYDDKGEKIQMCVHRISFILANGPIGSRDFLKHNCKNRMCVNPRHLYIRKIIEMKMPPKGSDAALLQRAEKYNRKNSFKMTEKRDRVISELGYVNLSPEARFCLFDGVPINNRKEYNHVTCP